MANWIESELITYQKSHPCVDHYTNGEPLKCCRWKWTQVLKRSSLQIGVARRDGLPPTVCAYDMGTACFEGQEEAARKSALRFDFSP